MCWCSCVRVLWVARAWWRTKMSSRFPWNLVERRPIVEAGSFFNLLFSVWNSLIYAKVAALRRKPTFINRTMIIDVDSHVSALFSLHFHLASCFSITHSIIPVLFFSGGVLSSFTNGQMTCLFWRSNEIRRPDGCLHISLEKVGSQVQFGRFISPSFF